MLILILTCINVCIASYFIISNYRNRKQKLRLENGDRYICFHLNGEMSFADVVNNELNVHETICMVRYDETFLNLIKNVDKEDRVSIIMRIRNSSFLIKPEDYKC